MSLITAGCISRETALKAIAGCYDIEHVDNQPVSLTADDI